MIMSQGNPHDAATPPSAVLVNQIPTESSWFECNVLKFQRQAQKPYYTLALAILEPSQFAGHVFRAGSIAARKPCGS